MWLQCITLDYPIGGAGGAPLRVPRNGAPFGAPDGCGQCVDLVVPHLVPHLWFVCIC